MSPRYSAFAVMTVDGKIARHAKQYVDWSSAADKKFLHQALNASDVIIIGRKTFDTLKKRKKQFPKKRRYIVLTRRVKTIHQSGGAIFCNADKVDIDALVRQLRYRRVAVLGGAHIYSLMLARRLLNEFYITIEPMTFGDGISLLNSPATTARWKLISARRLSADGTLLLHYSII